MSLLLSNISKTLPPVNTLDFRSLNNSLFKELNKTCVVIDDDPTGNQTVYDIPLLTEWDLDTIVNEFKNETPVFFLLTNSRSLTEAQSTEIYQEISKNIEKASKLTQREFNIISRSDSTLRGHFPSEINAIKHGGDYENTITVFIPVMFEGGRMTLNDTHYISNEDTITPVNETPFANDHTFGYTKGNLKEWIVEKTQGEIKTSDIFSFSIEAIRTQNVQALKKQVLNLSAGSYLIANAQNYNDLDIVTNVLLLAEKAGKKIVYRTSSSFVPSYIGLPSKNLLKTKDIITKNEDKGGLMIVGSYVPKSSSQLHYLLSFCDKENTIEVDVEQILNSDSTSYIKSISAEIDKKINSGIDVVVYTSRKLITGDSKDSNINIGLSVSKALITIVNSLSITPKYLLAKGGITSHDIATKGLEMKRSKVLGQIIPGVPVWEMSNETKFPSLPYIVFPGNVGDEKSLYLITQKLTNHE